MNKIQEICKWSISYKEKWEHRVQVHVESMNFKPDEVLTIKGVEIIHEL